MKKMCLMALAWCCFLTVTAQQPVSPNGKLTLKTTDKGFCVYYQQQEVLNVAATGYEGLAQKPDLKYAGEVKADYQMLSGKKLHCTNEAREYKTELGKGLQLVVRLYNDGIAFRYELKGLNNQPLPKEQTAYMIPEGMKPLVRK